MDNNKDKMIKDMNHFLRGVHMGGATFKDYLNKAEDPELKNELTHTIESFKRHEEAITNRIEQLGGNASDSLGIMGTMSEFFEKIKLIPVNTDLEVCKYAVEAMEMGLYQGNKFLAEHKDLDPSLRKEAEGVVQDYDNQLNRIKEMMNKLK
jgi:Domain of unknown function (DUF2383)